MSSQIFPFRFPLRTLIMGAAMAVIAVTSHAAPQHGIAMYGAPDLPPEFTAFPYVNPGAPKGGRIVFAESGGFDSLNPYILKGNPAYGVGAFVFQSLMARSWDEPFTLYGLLAETVETGPDRAWVEFTLRPEARFSDGSPVTIEDVLWSFETLGTLGHPNYAFSWSKVEIAEITGPRSIRFTFNVRDQELPLILGLRPILKKAVYEGRAFDQSTLDIVPIGSGPYTIGRFEPGRFIELDRVRDWWAADLPAMRGQHNLDQIRYDYFLDSEIAFEAFKAGEVTAYRELNAAKWENGYDFPAVTSGAVVKSEIPNQRPTGIAGFVMNTRRAPFDDWRVRQAMLHLFNFEFINQTLNDGAQPRIRSYFDNSVLAMDHGPATGQVRALLAPFADDLLPGALDGYDLPVSDGSKRNRAGTRAAIALLNDAGYSVQDGEMRAADGTPLTFEILLNQGATSIMGGSNSQQMIDIYMRALERAGIEPTVTSIDAAQYAERTKTFDFGMTFYLRTVSLSPGNEQRFYWGAEAAGTEGSRNWMGARNPAIDAMIDAMLSADNQEDFTAAVKALDRVLTTGRYVIPIWYSAIGRLAHSATLRYPEDRVSIYGDWRGFLPDVWWHAPTD